jgi:tRNA(Arg) A34 adenosine deaminase TadA
MDNSFHDLARRISGGEDEIISRLMETDKTAIEGVNAGLGGPFGSSVVVYYQNQFTGQQEGYRVSIDHNRVVSTGYPGAHAENNALVAAREQLVKFLRTHPDSFVVVYSSAESCPECRSKLETVARFLEHEGLLQPGNFYCVYGATFEDTEKIAKFNDAAYLADLKRAEGDRSIKVEVVSVAQAVQMDGYGKIARALSGLKAHMAFIVDTSTKVVFGIGEDETAERGVLATAVSAAVRDAGKGRSLAGIPQPWNLQGATLVVTYGAKEGIGPRTYTTGLWANLGGIVTIDGLDLPKGTQYSEAHGISNSNFFEVIKGSYDHPQARVITVPAPQVREELRAQRHWRSLLDSERIPAIAVYNGLRVRQ